MQLGKNTRIKIQKQKIATGKNYLSMEEKEQKLNQKGTVEKKRETNLLEFSVLNKFDIFQTKNSAQFDYTSILR